MHYHVCICLRSPRKVRCKYANITNETYTHVNTLDYYKDAVKHQEYKQKHCSLKIEKIMKYIKIFVHTYCTHHF